MPRLVDVLSAPPEHVVSQAVAASFAREAFGRSLPRLERLMPIFENVPPWSDPLCPADGRIIYVEDVPLRGDAPNAYHRRVQASFGLDGAWTVVATYLSIFDAHFVRAPIAGRVRLHHVEAVGDNRSMGGSFLYAAVRRPLPMGRRDYTEKNEFLGVSLEGAGPRILLVLMADWWIDQIVTLVEDGDQVERGHVIGKIQMGSQVDVWTPAGALRIAPTPGDSVRAGETVLGSLAGA